MSALIKRFVREEEGATMVEYGLMVALIAVVCILVVAAVGTELGGIFDDTQLELKNAPANQVTPS